MFDDQHGVALCRQSTEHLDQALDVGTMQAGGGFVEEVEGGVAAGAELARQFDALRFAAGERGAGLAEGEVAQAQIAEHPQGSGNLGKRPNSFAASSMVMARMSAMDLPDTVAARVSRLKREPPQDSQGTRTSGRKFIATLTWPWPLHSSQRPPLTLKEKRPGAKPRTRASGRAAKSFRISSHTPT